MTRNTYPSLARPGDTIPPAAPLDVLRPMLESQVLVDWLVPLANGRLLDLGCGNGYMALAFARRGADLTEITGVDLNAEVIAVARETAISVLDEQAPPTRFVVGDVRKGETIERLGCFNFVVCNPPFFERCLSGQTKDPARKSARAEVTLGILELCQTAARLLVPGGRLALCHLARRRKQIAAAFERNEFTIEREIAYEGVRSGDGGIVYFLASYSTQE